MGKFSAARIVAFTIEGPLCLGDGAQLRALLARNLKASWSFLVRAGLGVQTMIRLVCVCVATMLACVSAPAAAETCVASQYGYGGSQTASGERMNPSAMTAAHRTRSFGSQVTVTSQKSGRSVTVRINDRGPFVKGRCIDLSTAAAHALGMGGTERVSIN